MRPWCSGAGVGLVGGGQCPAVGCVVAASCCASGGARRCSGSGVRLTCRQLASGGGCVPATVSRRGLCACWVNLPSTWRAQRIPRRGLGRPDGSGAAWCRRGAVWVGRVLWGGGEGSARVAWLWWSRRATAPVGVGVGAVRPPGRRLLLPGRSAPAPWSVGPVPVGRGRPFAPVAGRSVSSGGLLLRGAVGRLGQRGLASRYTGVVALANRGRGGAGCTHHVEYGCHCRMGHAGYGMQ